MAEQQKSILIATQGTRGDVQPLIALGLGLLRAGWSVALSAPGEYCSMVEDYGLLFLDSGRSLQRELHESATGQRLRAAGALTALRATRDFFSVELFDSWFQAISGHCKRLQPDVLLLTSFTALCGAAAIPRLLGLPTRVAVAHPVPMGPTAEFGVPVSGKGFSTGLPLLNRWQWAASAALVARGTHAKTARKVVQRAVAQLQAQYQKLLPGAAAEELGPGFGLEGKPTLYIYSPALLPKPADWGPNCHVVGALVLRQQPALFGAPAREGAHKPAAPSGQTPPLPAPEQQASCSSTAASSPCHGPPACLPENSSSFLIPAARPEDPQAAASTGPAGESEDPCPTTSSSTGSSCAGSAPSASARNRALQALAAAFGEPAGARASGYSSSQPAPGTEAKEGKESKEALLQLEQGPAPGLPPALQAFLDESFRLQVPVVYVGLGSMLGTAFGEDQAGRILGCVAEAVTQLAERRPVRAVIHTALGGGKSAQLAGGVPPGAPYYLLDVAVAHSLLLPQCALAVHHGGAGTTHATLEAGKPSLVVPCVPTSDQSFWGDLLTRRNLGPRWFHVRQLTAARLAAGLEEGLARLDEFTRNAEEMAVALHQEDGVGTAIAVLESMLG